MNNLNVFNNPKLPLKYPSNWAKTIKMFFRSFKYAYQRITRGFADCDVWDLDSYYLNIFHATLQHLAKQHWGYPGNEEFPTDESWTAYLEKMAQLFFQANESNEYYPNPEEEKWSAWIDANPPAWATDIINGHEMKYKSNAGENPYSEAMFQEERKNYEKREKDMRQGLEMLAHVFYHLWD